MSRAASTSRNPGQFALTSACGVVYGEISGDAVVTIELEKCTQLVQTSEDETGNNYAYVKGLPHFFKAHAK